MRVLIALDRTEQAAEAIRSLARWAEDTRPDIHLLHVVHPDHVPETAAPTGFTHSLTPAGTLTGQSLNIHEPYVRLAEDRSQALTRARTEAADFLRTLGASYFPDGTVTAHVEASEHTAAEIVRQAALLQPDFVAMAAGEHRRLGERIFGSIHEDVVRACSVPVLVVGPGVRARAQ